MDLVYWIYEEENPDTIYLPALEIRLKNYCCGISSSNFKKTHSSKPRRLLKLYRYRKLCSINKSALSIGLWYQKKDPNIAKEFTEFFYAGIQKININPLMYTKINEDYRRFLMKGFPYVIYYFIDR
jgi:hypothetical protein